eukprot:1440339-Rhodomonas_salina.1
MAAQPTQMAPLGAAAIGYGIGALVIVSALLYAQYAMPACNLSYDAPTQGCSVVRNTGRGWGVRASCAVLGELPLRYCPKPSLCDVRS